MHRILQPLYELLQLLDATLERAKLILLRSDGPLSRLLSCGGRLAELADPRQEPVTLAHTHRLPGRLVCTGRGGYRRRSSSVISRITSDPFWTCSRINSSFAARFSSARWRVLFIGPPAYRYVDNEPGGNSTRPQHQQLALIASTHRVHRRSSLSFRGRRC